ncbi:MAG: RNA polymerase sigma factor [Planctomycetota bacterium]|jgi:RNA polymerase sigma-70 factor (ECF subfamily)
MDNDRDYITLVKQAQLGDRSSLDDLAERVRPRLYAYVYRITLRDDVTQDIVQETMLEMFQIFDKLERADRFWPWLRGIGFNMIRRQRKSQRRHKAVSLSTMTDTEWSQAEPAQSTMGLANLMGQELKQVVFNVMRRLKPRYRTVLSMRCYEQMEYSQIAELMGCNELSVRVLFHRAKKAMYSQLSRRGFGKGALLTVLALFGKMTAPSEAAAADVSVTASTTSVGLWAGLIGTAASKTTVVTVTAAAVVAVGAVVAPMWFDRAASWTEKTARAVKQKMTIGLYTRPQLTDGHDEYWYYYPAQAPGPVVTRLVKWDAAGRHSYCQRLENDRANYRFDISTKTIHINNHRMWRDDLRVRRLPADEADLREFLSMVEGKTAGIDYVSSKQQGLLVIARQNGGENSSLVQMTHHHNVLDEEYFRYNWPVSAVVVDNRDAMHKRGWTYFTVTGRINGRDVSGTGRIPFVYAATKGNPAWLKLDVADSLKITDGAAAAGIYDLDKRRMTTYPAGTFFKGLPRPWMGLHTIDTVRRDAAEQSMWFKTEYSPGSETAEVILTKERTTLRYIINMERDVIEKITLSATDSRGRNVQAELEFSYLEEIEQAGPDFTEPRRARYGIPQKEDLGILWLVSLAEAAAG